MLTIKVSDYYSLFLFVHAFDCYLKLFLTGQDKQDTGIIFVFLKLSKVMPLGIGLTQYRPCTLLQL